MKSLGIYAFTSLMVLQSISSFAEVTEITSPNQFDQVVLASKKPVVVKVGAPWCSACERAKGPFKKISENPDFSHIVFAEMDFDKILQSLKNMMFHHCHILIFPRWKISSN